MFAVAWRTYVPSLRHGRFSSGRSLGLSGSRFWRVGSQRYLRRQVRRHALVDHPTLLRWRSAPWRLGSRATKRSRSKRAADSRAAPRPSLVVDAADRRRRSRRPRGIGSYTERYVGVAGAALPTRLARRQKERRRRSLRGEMENSSYRSGGIREGQRGVDRASRKDAWSRSFAASSCRRCRLS